MSDTEGFFASATSAFVPPAAPATDRIAAAPAPAAPAANAPAATAPAAAMVTFDRSAAKGVLTSVVTGAVRVAGTFLMAHGAMTQATADAIAPIIVQEIVGTGLVVGGQFWASLREWLKHQKLLSAAFADPSTIVVK